MKSRRITNQYHIDPSMNAAMTPSEKHNQELRHKLNRETSRMPWPELQPHFASGIVIGVGNDLDLVDVAVQIANDNKAAVADWMASGRLGRVTDAQAAAWLEDEAMLWTVVVKPWILVQLDRIR